jgi:glutamate 5-kinase
MRKEIVSRIRKVVVKVGTSILTQGQPFIEAGSIARITRDITGLLSRKINVCLVTSGAISCGMALLGTKSRPRNLPQLQATAAVGQRKLMDLYADEFGKYGLQVAQILLTREDLKDRQRYLNARNTILTLWENRVIPVINENDTVAVEEIKFGDNDRLSALVASLLDADLLILLSDVEGFYEGAKLLKTVSEITAHIEKLACDTDKEFCIGGMSTKLEAVKIVQRAGIPCIIADGTRENILENIIRGDDIGTLFLPQKEKLDARKQWMAFNLKPQGKIYLDRGAVEAVLKKGKSLLSAGIVIVEGSFKEADLVSIIDISAKKEIGRGLTNYSDDELNKIKGLKTQEIARALGYKYYDEVIHRDNLALL